MYAAVKAANPDWKPGQPFDAAFKSHSTDKDSFYTKKATKKVDYEELWEEQRLKKERENERLNKKYYEERLDNEYYDSLIEKRTYYQQQSVASLYEKGTVVAELYKQK